MNTAVFKAGRLIERDKNTDFCLKLIRFGCRMIPGSGKAHTHRLASVDRPLCSQLRKPGAGRDFFCRRIFEDLRPGSIAVVQPRRNTKGKPTATSPGAGLLHPKLIPCQKAPLCGINWKPPREPTKKQLPRVSMTLKKWGHYPKYWHGHFFYSGHGDSR